MRSTAQRVIAVHLACLLLTAPTACRKLFGGEQVTSLDDVEANLEELVGPAETGLELEVSPRFMTFGPLPAAAPWETPVSGKQGFEAHGKRISFKTGRDGLIHERYEARACPLREIWSCVELWATGRFGKDGQLACIGLRLEKGATIERRKLDMRTADNCPLTIPAPGPAQQVVRGIEKAQLEHARKQESDQYLNPKAE